MSLNETIVSGIYILSRPASIKHPSYKIEVLVGIFILLRLRQFPKVYETKPYLELLPNSFTPSGINIVSKAVHPAKLAAPMDSRLSGSITDINLVHPLKAPADILVIDDGIETEVIWQS